MDGKIRVLINNRDQAGVSYFRSLTPAMELERNHSDEFYVEINPNIDFDDPNTINYLKSFHIIHYHRQLIDDVNAMLRLAAELRKSGTILIVDIDDYWHLSKKHPFYYLSIEQKLYQPIIDNLKIADYVTTTSEIFAEEIKSVTGKDNVIVLYNSVNPDWMRQFQNNWKPDPDGRVRICYAAGSCYDDKTEIFTENGWKLFKDLNENEKVATLNPNNNLFEFQLPINYINQPYSGEMYYGKNKLIDFAVTPNHNMFISKSKRLNRKNKSKLELIKMEDLNDYDLTFKKNCDWIGENTEYYIIPEYFSKNKTKYPEIKIKMEDWLKFFGYWVGDGWTTKDGSKQVGIAGFKKLSVDTINEIKEIFDEYGISSTYTKNGNTLRFFNIQLYTHLSQFGGAVEKYIPKNILDLKTEHLKIFLEYYIKADGNLSKTGRITAYTASPKLANNLNEIALKIGVAATIKNRGLRISKTPLSDGRIINTKHDSYVVTFYRDIFKNYLTPTLSCKKIKKEKYLGNIYCVTVPNHVIYVRRNGLSYWCGNSHAGDVEQLETVMNVISNDPDLKDKFKIILAGWDAEGVTTDIIFNEEFGNELQKRGLWTNDVVKAINKSKGDIDRIPKIPNDLRNKYRGKIFEQRQRDIKSEESVYLLYEKILTDNHKMIKDKDYLSWLMNFERDVVYENEGNYARRWTKKANMYATVLDECDVVIAPLDFNKFNTMKSNLKQVECWSRKLPILCSDMPPYNVDGRHMENCILIPTGKEAHKYWKKYLKRIILDADLRKRLGEQLYNDFSVKYHLSTVTKKRADFYKSVVYKTLEL